MVFPSFSIYNWKKNRVPEGLEDVSKYPDLFAVLLSRGWTETDLEKVAGLNLLRVFRGAEAVESLFLLTTSSFSLYLSFFYRRVGPWSDGCQ